MIKLTKYLKPYLLFAILGPAFMLVEVFMDLYLPMIMSNIVNVGVAEGNMDYVLKMGGRMMLISLFSIMGGVGSAIFATKASMNFAKDVRLDLFKKVQTFSFANLDKFKSSSLITRLTNDVTQIQQVVATLLRMMVRSPMLFIGGVFMAYSINKELAGIFIISVPLIIIIFVLVLRNGFPLFMIVQKKLDKLNLVMRENLAGVRVVKAFVRGDFERNKFNIANDDLMQTTVSAFYIISLLFPGAMCVMNLAVLAVLWYGGKLYQAGGMLIGDIMAYVNYMTQILMSLLMLAMGIMGISRGKVSAERINEVLEAEVDIADPDKFDNRVISKGTVEFRNVTFQYPGSTGDPVLVNLSFSAKKGEVIGISGETGSGKTTLTGLIPRLYDVTEGSVLVDGVDVKRFSMDFLRGKIGVVLQQSVLFTGTIKDNIKWGAQNATDEDVERVAKIAQAHDFILKQEKGYDTDLSQMGVNLSGGQKQRLAIARALIKKPEILIFDDSTSALDMVTEAKLLKSLREEQADCTKFIVAQRISSVIEADKILVLQSGEIKAAGRHEELLQESEIYRDIYYSQRKEEVLAQ